ncbi:hypothetical protein BKA01_003047 [Pseudonocardia eucalypti]|nr:hypothetical protein [Pseudonocardia eucalypti]
MMSGTGDQWLAPLLCATLAGIALSSVIREPARWRRS